MAYAVSVSHFVMYVIFDVSFLFFILIEAVLRLSCDIAYVNNFDVYYAYLFYNNYIIYP